MDAKQTRANGGRVMKVLTLTTLYPNAAMPSHGVFVENRLRAFVEKSRADVRVCAPVPWFPLKNKVFGQYSRWANAPRSEKRSGVAVSHPQYFIPPKVGMTYAAAALEKCFRAHAEKLIADGWDFDLIDAHYLYPDGVAAVRVAKQLGKPVVITARGTDVNLIPKFPRQRAMILEAVRNADAVICVAAALRDELIRLGAPSEKIHIMRNGVDLTQFQPLDRTASRAKFDLNDGPVLTSVGHLIDRKGHDLVIEALNDLPEATLLIAGDGEKRTALKTLAQKIGVADRVKFLGAVPHHQLASVYSAADCLVLASSREGWPNVLLEAMACGTPAVAAPIWGCGEVITASEAGRLTSNRTAKAFAKEIAELLQDPPLRSRTRAYAENFSWDETARRQEDLFQTIVDADKLRKRISFQPATSIHNANTPRLIVTVDTEEAFDWNEFDHPETRVCPSGDIKPFQSICDDAGAKPVYLLTYPLLQNLETAAWFSELDKQGRAETGLHLHQWVTPPVKGFAGEYYSYQMNLPAEVHAEKFNALADAFEQRMGRRARAHRAGRYGLNAAQYHDLAAAGVTHDFSPTPGFDQSPAGGPNFTAMSNMPFAAAAGKDKVWVTPVCGARAIKRTRRFLKQSTAQPGFDFEHRRAATHTTPMRLTCEGTTLKDLKALTAHLLKENTPVLTFSFHSTTLTAGANTYVPDADAVAHALDLTRAYFQYFRNEIGGAFVTIDDLASLYGAQS